MNKKNLDHYLKLDYPVMLERVGREYEAWHPDFGRGTMFVRAKSVEDALKQLEAFRQDLIRTYIERGVPVPEPSTESEARYSGNFVLRVPRELHVQLARDAKRNGVSMNQYLVHILSERRMLEEVSGVMEQVQELLKENRSTKIRRAAKAVKAAG